MDYIINGETHHISDEETQQLLDDIASAEGDDLPGKLANAMALSDLVTVTPPEPIVQDTDFESEPRIASAEF
jgi:hypothetical protein